MTQPSGLIAQEERWHALLNEAATGKVNAARTAIVVAHPDDETVAMGGLLAGLSGITIIHLTDGAPQDPEIARWHGFSTVGSYRQARRRELATALSMADVPETNRIDLAFADQRASFNLPAIATRLAELLTEIRCDTVFCHAYEGGHPDHDAAAFVVAAAADLMEAVGSNRPQIVEMPLYHLRDGDWCRQRFAEGPGGDGVLIALSPVGREQKRTLMGVFASQAETLMQFTVDEERYRSAPRHDFQTLPNGGMLLYERYDWGMHGDQWIRLATDAASELGLMNRQAEIRP